MHKKTYFCRAKEKCSARIIVIWEIRARVVHVHLTLTFFAEHKSKTLRVMDEAYVCGGEHLDALTNKRPGASDHSFHSFLPRLTKPLITTLSSHIAQKEDNYVSLILIGGSLGGKDKCFFMRRPVI